MTKSGNHESYKNFIPQNKEFVAFLYNKSIELGDKNFSNCIYAELPDNLKRSASDASSRSRSSRVSSSTASTNRKNEMVQSHTDAALSFSERMKTSAQYSSRDRFYKLLEEIPKTEEAIGRARADKKAAPKDSSERKNIRSRMKNLKAKLAAMMAEKEGLRKSLGIAEPNGSSSSSDDDDDGDEQ